MRTLDVCSATIRHTPPLHYRATKSAVKNAGILPLSRQAHVRRAARFAAVRPLWTCLDLLGEGVRSLLDVLTDRLVFSSPN